LYTQFIKKLIDLPDFTIASCHELENGWVFQLQPSKQCPICPVCFGKTQRHAVIHRRLRHTFSWNTGTIWIDVPFYRQRCTTCPLTFTFDYGLEAS
jgi:transposase